LWSMRNLAMVLREQGDLEGARVLLFDVVEGCRRVLGPSHQETLSSIESLVTILRQQGRQEEARSLYEQICK
jgi:hypothetical protein